MNPLLLLHGALGSAEQLKELKSILEPSGRQIFTMNFSGHGGKPFASEFGIEQFADETLRFLAEKKLSRVDVFGYSMGGYVALYASLLKPKSFGRIVTLGTKFDWTKASSEAEVKKLNPEKILEKVPAFAETLARRHAPVDWKEVVNHTASMMLSLGENALLNENNLPCIVQKVLIALGDQDGMTSSDYSELISKQIPNGKFVLVPNTQHPIEKINLKVLREILLEHL